MEASDPKLAPTSPNAINQSVSPMPQVSRPNGFSGVSAPQSVGDSNPSNRRNNQIEDFVGGNNSAQPTNIGLLSRGLQLLSITQLRELLREYSLPTGGNKQSLVNRLIIFLETFGPTQQNSLVQFSLRLKKLLSAENRSEETEKETESPMLLLPPEISQRFSTSPSALFEISDKDHLAYGPVMIQSKLPSEIIEFSLPPSNSKNIPILQFAPVFPDSPLKTIKIQLLTNVMELSDPALWCPVKEMVNKPITFQVLSTEPNVPIIAVVQWMKRVSLSTIVKQIFDKEPLPYYQPNPGEEINGICHLTHKILTQPCRSIHCKHANCIDLTGFISASIATNVWQCPICHQSINVEDIRCDPNYFIHVHPKGMKL